MTDAPPRIDSPRNAQVQELRKLRERGDGERFFVEGARLVQEALASGLRVQRVLRADGFARSERAAEMAAALAAIPDRVQECSDAVMDRISGLDTPPGIVGVFERPALPSLRIAPDSVLCMAAGVRDPGNLGALVRCAEAAGVHAVVALSGSADPYRDKALRASAGSAFRVPCFSGVTPELVQRWVLEEGLRLVTTEAGAETSLWEAQFGAGPLGFVFGAEGAGISREWTELAAVRVRIPMSGRVESLNVAVAAGLVLFEHARRG